jgi:signal transduction histidine kinase
MTSYPGQAEAGRSAAERLQEIQVAHELALALQSAVDITELQERVLRLITGELGYERATMALADSSAAVLSGWLCSTCGPGAHLQRIAHTERISLEQPDWPLTEALRSGQPALIDAQTPPTADPRLNALLGVGGYVLLPMVLRARPLGLLLVDNPLSGKPLDAGDLALLSHVAEQTTVVLGGLQLIVGRAQRLAVEEERNRIAREIHDSIAQQLYGIAYTIDACLRLLPEQPEQAAAQLRYLQPQAQQALTGLRRAIFDLWPEALDAARFQTELAGYLAEIAPAGPQLFMQIDHGIEHLPEVTRRQLYRIAQEGLNNVVKHARARRAKLTLLTRPRECVLRIADDGQGFDTATILGPGRGVSFGLLSMRERAEALGGTLRIDSFPGEGTTLTVVLPGPTERGLDDPAAAG